MKQGIDISDYGGNYANSAVTGANYDRFCFAHWSHFEKDTPHPRLKKNLIHEIPTRHTPVGKRRNDNVIMASNRRRDVVSAL